MAFGVTSAESTDLFTGPRDAPLQIVRVTHTGAASPIVIEGDGLSTPAPPPAGPAGVTEVPVAVSNPVGGERRTARLSCDGVDTGFEFEVAEPGWTMFMVSHFHYDPVWWNTQAAYTSLWTEEPPGRCRQTNGFNLVAAHLEMARREPEYKFVLAEVDYLKPYWDTHPEDRADLRRFIADGRVEIMGGTYNEPNTNLTSPETTIRNFVHGIGFQRDVIGAHPATAWQLDAFGHDPQFPGMAADAGLTSSSWARGPHHQWGPMQNQGDPERMQFSSEFEWVSPSGRGVLTHYMPAHYSAGWWMDSSATLEEAETATYELFSTLKKVALTRNVLLPVGTDYTPPNKWVTEIHRDWNARYTWPQFVCGLPSEFFAAVRAELAERGIEPSPQTRDMNPIYTGKDVSYIDTKQANRDAENAVLDGERFAVFAALIGGANYPQAALEKAWAQLVYGAHHDAITGSESDQVYIDLLTGWRDAWELGRAARDNALALISSAVDGSVVVWNSLTHIRTDVVTATFDEPLGTGVRVTDADGKEVPALVEHGGRSVSWLARDVPSLGWRAYHLSAAETAVGWEPVGGAASEIANDCYRLRVDPDRGGVVTSLTENGRELLGDGGFGNELAVYDEYPAHPDAGEGPWHLLPKGPAVVSSSAEAESVRRLRSPLGERLLVAGRIGTVLRYTQTLTLWRDVARVDCSTTIDEFTGEDKLLRMRWPCPVAGAMPVSEVGDAVVGRGFALLHEPGSDQSVDTAKHPYTLDNPAYGWFGLSSAARVRVNDSVRAISVAEVISPTEAESAWLARDLMVALVRAGVTATCSSADRARYGNLDVDSNLPDARIALGGPDENAFTAAVLADADPAYAEELKRQLYASGSARVWVPAAAPLAAGWLPGADLRGVRALPVLVVAGGDGLDAAVAMVVDDLADAEIAVEQQVQADIDPFDARTVAVLNRGVPSFAVDTEGTLHTALMRSCTGWPSGVWMDPQPRRTAPDGSNFQLQHWTHTFDYALVSGDGDWRASAIPERSAEFSHPLIAVVNSRGEGGLPSSGSLLRIEPEGSVQLAALKAAGNPLASGSGRAVDAGEAVALRLVETRGVTTDVAITSGLHRVSAASRVNLLEEPRLQKHRAFEELTVHGFEIATVLSRLNMPRLLDADHTQLAPEVEAAQPLYARYWLHNRGPAPLGGLPAAVHLHPHATVATPDGGIVLRLTAASDCTDSALHGTVRLLCPPGWTASPQSLPFVLPGGGHLEADIELTMPRDTPHGLYPIRAQLHVTGSDAVSMPASWRQVVEDVATVSVGTPREDDDVVHLISEPTDIEVGAGDADRLVLSVGTAAAASLSLEAHVISPWGTWDWIGPAVVGAVVTPGETTEIGFDVSPSPQVRPGQWWALVRIGCAGRLLYTPAVKVTVR